VAQGLAEYWKSSFPFKKIEDFLNQYKQYKLPANGIDLHFLHEPSDNPDAIPLLFLHGWPGSFFEVYKILPILKEGERVGISLPVG
jgi:Epoxide hydrolase N terminus